MNILGIHDGHSASACLLQDGRAVAAIQEERLSRQKNQGGTPRQALTKVLEVAGTTLSEVDAVALSTRRYRNQNMATREDVMAVYQRMFEPEPKGAASSASAGDSELELQKRRAQLLIQQGVPEARIHFVDHHECHAFTAYYGRGTFDRDILVLTNDGQGDGLCASVSIGRAGQLRRVAEVSRDDSIAAIYSFVTFLLGFVPLEHEYKLMGMAPYAEGSREAERVCRQLEAWFELPDGGGLTWSRRRGVPPVSELPPRLASELKYGRFDAVMGGLQLFIENIATRWVRNVIRATGVADLAVAGGLFMNVKLNQKLMALPEVRSAYFCPSCSDESNSLGAAWSVWSKQAQRSEGELAPLTSLYLGTEYTDEQIGAVLASWQPARPCRVTRVDDIDARAAELLAQKRVVARFAGRMEFGARALGNRSILANPSDPDACALINRMIKQRDFWMPFAPSILAECADEYLHNEKRGESPFMTLAFDLRASAREKLRAARHAHDGSCRPQILSAAQNPSYHALVSRFRALTGIGAVLNTSFNLHGFPIVESPSDALRVFDSSGLQALALGAYLVEADDAHS
jgi:carbamoyltransferase